MSAVPVQNPLAEGFRATGRRRSTGRTTGRATGRPKGGALCPNFNFMGLLSIHPPATIIFSCTICANTNEKQTYIRCKRFADGQRQPRSASIKGAVCHPRYAWQRHALSRPFLNSRTSACVNNTQRCCQHSSNKSAKGF